MEITTPGKLDKNGLFLELSEEIAQEAEGLCTWRRFEVGEEVFDIETDSREVFFIVEGGVRIFGLSPEGEHLPIAEMHAGNSFGELAAIDGGARSACVVATAPALLASMTPENFRAIMFKYPVLGHRMMLRMAKIIRSLDNRIPTPFKLTPEQRVMLELIKQAQPDTRLPDDWIIPQMPNHKDIAQQAGTTRDIVAETIGQLAREGILRRRNSGMLITDWTRLKLLALAGQPRSANDWQQSEARALPITAAELID